MKHYGQEEQYFVIQNGIVLLSVYAAEAMTTGLKVYNALKILKAEGSMGDLDDGPEQKPLDENEVEQIF